MENGEGTLTKLPVFSQARISGYIDYDDMEEDGSGTVGGDRIVCRSSVRSGVERAVRRFLKDLNIVVIGSVIEETRDVVVEMKTARGSMEFYVSCRGIPGHGQVQYSVHDIRNKQGWKGIADLNIKSRNDFLRFAALVVQQFDH